MLGGARPGVERTRKADQESLQGEHIGERRRKRRAPAPAPMAWTPAHPHHA